MQLLNIIDFNFMIDYIFYTLHVLKYFEGGKCLSVGKTNIINDVNFSYCGTL